MCHLSEDYHYTPIDTFAVLDFHDRLAVSCIYSFLSQRGLEKTLSVFLAEIGFDSVKSFLSENEIDNILHLTSFHRHNQPYNMTNKSKTVLNKIFHLIEDMRIQPNVNVPPVTTDLSHDNQNRLIEKLLSPEKQTIKVVISVVEIS